MYVKRVKALGLDACYLEEPWMGAFLSASEWASAIVQVLIQLGLSTLNVTLVMPYVVSKPRRRRKRISIEEEEVLE